MFSGSFRSAGCGDPHRVQAAVYDPDVPPGAPRLSTAGVRRPADGVTVHRGCPDFRGQRRENGSIPLGPEGDRHIFQSETGRKMSPSQARERLPDGQHPFMQGYTFTSMRRGRTLSLLGTVIRSTPSLYSAWTWSALTSDPSGNTRRN